MKPGVGFITDVYYKVHTVKNYTIEQEFIHHMIFLMMETESVSHTLDLSFRLLRLVDREDFINTSTPSP